MFVIISACKGADPIADLTHSIDLTARITHLLPHTVIQACIGTYGGVQEASVLVHGVEGHDLPIFDMLRARYNQECYLVGEGYRPGCHGELVFVDNRTPVGLLTFNYPVPDGVDYTRVGDDCFWFAKG